MLSDTAWGWLAVLGACICFGSFGVPIKSPSVLKAKVDPLVIQCYKTFWFFTTSFLVLTYNSFHFTPWGLLSAVIWVPAGIAAVIAIHCIGLSVAQGVWNGLIVVVSFLWGAVIFHEPLKSVPLAVLAIGLLAMGVVGMATSPLIIKLIWKDKAKELEYQKIETESEQKAQVIPKDEENVKILQARLLASPPPVSSAHEGYFLEKNETNSAKPAATEEEVDEYVQLPCCLIKRTHLGYLAAAFNGLYGGSVAAPLKFAKQNGEQASDILYIVSFAIGAVVINTIIFVVYTGVRVFILEKEVPDFQLRVMAIPGSLSGILWSAGNFFSLYAVILLGQSIGYPSVQASLIVSGMWGIFYYKEMRGICIFLWFISAFCAVGGIVLLSQMKG